MDFALRLWQEALKYHDLLPQDMRTVETEADFETHVIRKIASLLAVECTREYIVQRVQTNAGILEALDVGGDSGTAEIINGMVNALSRMREGSAEETVHFFRSHSPGMMVMYDDRRKVEVRYLAWISAELKEQLGLRQ